MVCQGSSNYSQSSSPLLEVCKMIRDSDRSWQTTRTQKDQFFLCSGFGFSCCTSAICFACESNHQNFFFLFFFRSSLRLDEPANGFCKQARQIRARPDAGSSLQGFQLAGWQTIFTTLDKLCLAYPVKPKGLRKVSPARASLRRLPALDMGAQGIQPRPRLLPPSSFRMSWTQQRREWQ